jgi:hypothetical protein
MAILAALLSLALAPLGPVSKQNTTAESVERLSLELGIDFDHENAKAEHPTKEARESPGRPAVGTWLEAELTRDDDAISEPPVPAREFLKTHRDAIGGIVSALEKASPRWGDGDAAKETDSPHGRIAWCQRSCSRGSSWVRPWSRSETGMGWRPIELWKPPGLSFSR